MGGFFDFEQIVNTKAILTANTHLESCDIPNQSFSLTCSHPS